MSNLNQWQCLSLAGSRLNIILSLLVAILNTSSGHADVISGVRDSDSGSGLTITNNPAGASRLYLPLIFGPTSNLMALAGPDQDVNRGEVVALTGNAGPNTGATAFTWTQVSGADVTGGAGALFGQTVIFTAPTAVSTIEFDLRVSDENSLSPPDRIIITILEDKARALFVNPGIGDDAHPGTRAEPFHTLQAAINKSNAQGLGADVYVIQDVYAESLTLRSGVSVYGGFSNGWLRDSAWYTTTLSGGLYAVSGQGVSQLTLDGLNLLSADAAQPSVSSSALYLSQISHIVISNNRLTSGNGGSGISRTAGAAGDDGGDGAMGNAGACCQSSLQLIRRTSAN